MPDRPKSTPSPPEPNPAFRQTYLWRLDTPEHVQAAAWLGDLFDTLVNEGGMFGPREDRRPGTFREVESAAAELEATAAYLEAVADTPKGSHLQPTEYPLCAAAAGWARQARETAGLIRQALTTDPKSGPAVVADPAVLRLVMAALRVVEDYRKRHRVGRGAMPLVDALEDALEVLPPEPE